MLNLYFTLQVHNFVCQDFGFRLDQLKDALIFGDAETEIYPIWLCPTRHVVIKGMEHMSIFKKDDVHVDIGIYGFVNLVNQAKGRWVNSSMLTWLCCVKPGPGLGLGLGLEPLNNSS